MLILTILLSLFFSLITTAILSYISMAVMIGPWIHSLIVIATSCIFSLIRLRLSAQQRITSIALITASSSIGGILATGCGFAFPTLYFLNKELFMSWLATPVYFVAIMFLISFTAGALGLLIADVFEHKLVVVDKLPFPIGELSYNLVALQNNASQTYQLIVGSLLSIGYSVVATLYGASQRIALFSGCSVYGLQLPALGLPTYELPLLLSIGFIAGTLITGPLALGLVSKVLLLTPLHGHFFDYISYNDFSFAFISGMVFYGALISLLELPKFFKTIIKKVQVFYHSSGPSEHKTASLGLYLQWVVVLLITSCFLSWFKFSFALQIYLVLFTAVCTYQLLVIGGEMGMAPIARFATFVMMPALFIFKPNYEQLTLISTFVEVCGGVAVDVLFGRKLAQLSSIRTQQIKQFQWLGLIISSLVVGIVFWLLITKLGLGSSALIAQRGQTRALTIQFQNFDFYAMIAGALYGSLLKECKANPIMVLGGILMPTEWVMLLMSGGLLATCMKQAKEYQLFWSGVFAVNSLVMIIKALW